MVSWGNFCSLEFSWPLLISFSADTMLLCRCDVDHSEFITDVIDIRDHKYVRGATVEIKSLQETLKEVKRLSKEFGFTAGMLKGSLVEGRKKND